MRPDSTWSKARVVVATGTRSNRVLVICPGIALCRYMSDNRNLFGTYRLTALPGRFERSALALYDCEVLVHQAPKGPVF